MKKSYFEYFQLHLCFCPYVSGPVFVNCFPANMHLLAKCMSTVPEIHIPLQQVNASTDRRMRTYLQLCPGNDLARDGSCEGGTLMDYTPGAAT